MRRTLARTCTALAGALVVLAPSEARADGLALHADAVTGYTRYSQAGPGFTLGIDAFARLGLAQAGLLADSTAGAGTDGNGSETAQSYAAAAGLAWYRKDVGLDVLGVFGAHVYSHVAAGLETSGVNGTVPFAQARVGVNLLTMQPFTLGLWTYGGDDLSRPVKQFSYTSPTPGAAVVTQPVTLGEWAWGFGLRIGVDLPL